VLEAVASLFSKGGGEADVEPLSCRSSSSSLSTRAWVGLGRRVSRLCKTAPLRPTSAASPAPHRCNVSGTLCSTDNAASRPYILPTTTVNLHPAHVRQSSNAHFPPPAIDARIRDSRSAFGTGSVGRCELRWLLTSSTHCCDVDVGVRDQQSARKKGAAPVCCPSLSAPAQNCPEFEAQL
jgi:hypothetical protein